MKTCLKLTLYLFVTIVIIVAILFSITTYLYYHPEKTKSLLVTYLTRNFNRAVEAKELQFKLQPLSLKIKGLKILQKDNPGKPEICIRGLQIESAQTNVKKWDIWHYKYIKLEGVNINFTDSSLRHLFNTRASPPGLVGKYFLKWFIKNLKTRFSVNKITLEDCSGTWQSHGLSARFEGFNVNVGKTSISSPGPLDLNLRKLELSFGDSKNGFRCSVTDSHASGTVSFENGKPRLNGNITVRNLEASSDAFFLRKSSFQARFLYTAPFLEINRLTFNIPEKTPLTFTGSGHEQIWGNFLADSELDTARKLLKKSSFKLVVLNIFELSGSASSFAENPEKLRVLITSSSVPVEKLVEIYRKSLPESVKKLRFLVPWHPQIRVSLTLSLDHKTPAADSEWEVRGPKLKISYLRNILECKPRIHLKLSLHKNRFLFAARSAIKDGVFQLSEKGSLLWETEFSLTGDNSTARVERIVLSARSAPKPILPEFTLKGKLALDLANSRIKDFKAKVQGRLIGETVIEGSGGWKEKDGINIIIDCRKHNFGKLLEFYRITHMPWQLIAKNRISINLSRPTPEQTQIKVIFKTLVHSFSDPDYQYGGDKISIQSVFSFDINSRRVLMKGSLHVPSGELLLNLYYLNFVQNAFDWKIKGEYLRTNKSFEIFASRWAIKNIITLITSATIRPNKRNGHYFNIRLKIPTTPVTRLFDFFVKEPYKDEFGYLSKVATTGKISMSFNIKGTSKNPIVLGRVFLNKVAVEFTDKRNSSYELDGSVPVRIRPFAEGRKKHADEKPLKGTLNFALHSVPFLGDYDFKADIYAYSNKIRINNHIFIKNNTFDLDIKPVEILYKPYSGYEIETGIRVNDVNLGKLISTMVTLNKPVDGHLKGNLSLLKITSGNLTTRGYLTAKIFKGTVKITHLSVENVFSENRILGADIDFTDLDLEELTAITNFGKITGVLAGYVHNLRIAYGQPISFDALFHTVKRKGIDQKINVKAVDNIAQLGGSGSSFRGLGKLVTVFFKEFPYEQIGIRCTLKNDVFTIRGTVISDHTEYLVKRKGFTGINVINRNPNNNISFKDMIKRLERITKTSQPLINP